MQNLVQPMQRMSLADHNPNPVPIVIPEPVQNLIHFGVRNRNEAGRFNPFLDSLPSIENIGAIQNL